MAHDLGVNVGHLAANLQPQKPANAIGRVSGFPTPDQWIKFLGLPDIYLGELCQSGYRPTSETTALILLRAPSSAVFKVDGAYLEQGWVIKTGAPKLVQI